MKPLHQMDDPPGDTLPPPAPRDRSSVVRDAIQAAIMDHRLPPGTKLTEDEIGASFGVSRTLVRAALQALSFSGLVTLERHRGAFVASPSAEEADQVFACRRLAEAELAALAAARCTAAHARILQAHLDEEEEAMRAGERRTAIRLSGELHLQIAEISENAILARFLGELVARSSLIIALYGASGSSSCGLAEHRELVAALEARDASRASQLMVQHLDHIRRDLDLSRRAATESVGSLLKL
ncbi:GntR family transcriptional regulator [Terrihabitans rhizophilus]